MSCYDRKLNILWEKTIAHKLHEISGLLSHYNVYDSAIHMVPLSIAEGSTGLVVVGLSMKPREANSEARIRLEQGLQPDKPNEHNDINIQSQLEHFSVYALNASDGNILWRHDGVDVRPEQYVRSLPLHARKVDLMSDLALHAHNTGGMNDWTVFRQSLIAELPHSWSAVTDSSIRIAHFVRRHLGAGAGNQVEKKTTKKNSKDQPSSSHIHTRVASRDSRHKYTSSKRLTAKFNFDLSRFTGVETPKLSLTASLPHNALEHTESPNVLVAHTSRGLEIISLRTGFPVTSLALNREQTYADLESDGVIDTIHIIRSPKDIEYHSLTQIHNNERLQHCMVIVTSGLPAQAQLFNGTICQNRRHLHDPVRRAGLGIPLEIKAAPPMIYHTLDERTLLESRIKSIAIAINTGVVTSYSGTGAFRWQVDGAPTWSLDFDQAYSCLLDTDAERAHELGGADKLQSQLFVMGDKNIAVLSRNGEILTMADVPSAPLTRPSFGDFDNDGITDVIIYTSDAILGYRLVMAESTKVMFLTLVLLSIVAVFSFIMNIRMNAQSQTEDTSASVTGSTQSSSTNILKMKYKRNVLALMRSTDDYHLE